MSRWLALDTSTDTVLLALQDGERLWQRELPGGAHASAELIPALLALLSEAGLALPQLQALVFGRGPGAFTGVRTACSVVQGLAFGADLPVLPVDSLLAVAEDARVRAGVVDRPWAVQSVLDARMDEVYTAALDWDGQDWQVAQAWQVCAPEQVQPSPGRVLAGNALPTYAGRLPDAPYIAARPCALAMLRLAPALWAAGQAVPADQAMPLYVRDKVALTSAERAALRAGPAA
jgi:tRNA threonylcarbamoyladenosine biosynthesis protein TsaB